MTGLCAPPLRNAPHVRAVLPGMKSDRGRCFLESYRKTILGTMMKGHFDSPTLYGDKFFVKSETSIVKFQFVVLKIVTEYK
jgi:hypothetical protein